jgi:hypothetical protein
MELVEILMSSFVCVEWQMGKVADSRAVGPIEGIDLSLAKRNLAEVQRALAAINYSDVWRHVGKLIRCGNVTVDTHKRKHGRGVRVKLHVADGDESRMKTVCDVTVDDQLRRYASENNREMNEWIAQVVKGALVKSLNTGMEFKVEDEG